MVIEHEFNLGQRVIGKSSGQERVVMGLLLSKGKVVYHVSEENLHHTQLAYARNLTAGNGYALELLPPRYRLGDIVLADHHSGAREEAGGNWNQLERGKITEIWCKPDSNQLSYVVRIEIDPDTRYHYPEMFIHPVNVFQTLPIEMRRLIERYQDHTNAASPDAVLNELIALGYAYWLEDVTPNPNPAYGATKEEDDALYTEWESTEGQKDRADQLDFALWFARRINRS